MIRTIVTTLFVMMFMTTNTSCNTEATLRNGSSIQLILLDELRSGRTKRGTRVVYEVADDVRDEYGRVLIRKGTKAYGQVTQSRAADWRGIRGIMEVSIDHTTSVDNQRINLQAMHHNAGPAIRGMINAGIWFVSAATWFIRGDNVVIPGGTLVMAKVQDDTVVRPTRMQARNYNPEHDMDYSNSYPSEVNESRFTSKPQIATNPY